jgi:hypothetical protein
VLGDHGRAGSCQSNHDATVIDTAHHVTLSTEL